MINESILFGNQKIYPLEMSMDLNRRETYVFIPLILLTLWFGMYLKFYLILFTYQ